MDIICSTCKISKNETYYSFKNKQNNKRNTICKTCHKIYRDDHYKNNKSKTLNKVYKRRKELIKLSSNYRSEKGCIDCGVKDYRILEYDHIKDKTKNISEMVFNGNSWSNILLEIEKCEVVCANCHRIRTWERNNNLR